MTRPIPRYTPPSMPFSFSHRLHLYSKFLNKPCARSFHATSANMTIKAYFECAWKGPKVKVDSKGNASIESPEAVGECPHQQKSSARPPAGLEVSAPHSSDTMVDRLSN